MEFTRHLLELRDQHISQAEEKLLVEISASIATQIKADSVLVDLGWRVACRKDPPLQGIADVRKFAVILVTTTCYP